MAAWAVLLMDDDPEPVNPIVVWWIVFGMFAACMCGCGIYSSQSQPRPTVRATGRPSGDLPRRSRRPLSNAAAIAMATATTNANTTVRATNTTVRATGRPSGNLPRRSRRPRSNAATTATASATVNANTTVVPPRVISIEHDRVQENTNRNDTYYNHNDNYSTPENHCHREQLILKNFEFRTIEIAIPSPPSNSKVTQLFRNLLFQQDERLQAAGSSSPHERRDLELGGTATVPDNKNGEDHDNDNDDNSEIDIRNNNDKSNHSWLFSNNSSTRSSFRSFFFQGAAGKSRSTPTECCSICLENYAVGDVVARLKKPNRKDDNRSGVHCKHWFHKDCISEWLQNHRECPLCRVDMIQE